jgi:hypothetical protein
MSRNRESHDAAPATHVANGNTYSAKPAPTLTPGRALHACTPTIYTDRFGVEVTMNRCVCERCFPYEPAQNWRRA